MIRINSIFKFNALVMVVRFIIMERTCKNGISDENTCYYYFW